MWSSSVQVPASKFFFLFEIDGELRISENEMYEPRHSAQKPLSEVRDQTNYTVENWAICCELSSVVDFTVSFPCTMVFAGTTRWLRICSAVTRPCMTRRGS